LKHIIITNHIELQILTFSLRGLSQFDKTLGRLKVGGLTPIEISIAPKNLNFIQNIITIFICYNNYQSIEL